MPYLTDRERLLARGAVDLMSVPEDAIPDPADRLLKREQVCYESTLKTRSDRRSSIFTTNQP